MQVLRFTPIYGLLLSALIFVSGCGPSVERRERREERDPLIQRALERKQKENIDGARDLFHKALQRRPELARAQLELGLLYDDHYEDYVRAIYHYQSYLEMRPDAQKRPIVEDLLRSARISYAASLPHQPSGALAEIRDLKNENRMLRRKIEDMMADAAGRDRGSSGQRNIAAPRQTSTPVPVPRPAPARSTSDTYVVQSGDTLSRIARRLYNDSSRWKEIYEANRGTLPSPQSLKVGQTLIIPR